MALETTVLSKNPWRVSLNIEGTHPIMVKVKLKDLLYEESTPAYRASTGNFYRLEHDVFVHYSPIYLSTGTVDTESGKVGTTYEYWKRYGMDFAPVQYDKRAKHRFIPNPNYRANYFESKNLNGYYEFDANSALYPSSLEQTFETLTGGIIPWHDPNAIGASDYPFQPLISVGLAGSVAGSSALLIKDPDPVFNATLTTRDGFKGYTSVALNPQNRATWILVQYITGKTPTELTNPITGDIETLKEFYSIGSNPALATAEVWLRCSWFGDYIATEEFGQDLNKKADVIHRNLIISANGDFNRYDELANGLALQSNTPDDVAATKSEVSRPYIPITTPAMDILSPRVLAGYETASIEDALRAAILASSGVDSTIGSIKTEPVNRAEAAIEHTGSTRQNMESLVPPGFFDPESRKLPTEYDHKPILISKYGGGTFDGRVMSPAIDELWVYIKRLVEGRAQDTTPDTSDNGAALSASVQRVIPKDTRIPAMTNFSFKFEDESTKVGSPINHTLISDQSGNAVKLRTTEFVNSPEGIKYSLFGNTLRLNTELITYNAARTIKNFLPWETVSPSETKTVTDGVLITTGDWAPRTNPLSLREVESRIGNLKYNIIANFRFLKENFAVTGPLGKTENKGDLSKEAAGSLYQFHRDYNQDVANPNTQFNPDSALPEANAYTPTGETTGKGNNGTGGHYGSAPELPSSSKDISAPDVYLGADGRWHYLFDHVRIPLLTEEY